MAAPCKKQDMPPPGGYTPINTKRIPARSFFTGWGIIGGYLGMTAAAAVLYHLNFMKVHRDRLERRSARLAIYPLLAAERDRAYLLQLRKNRDEEAALMANVEGWEVGTYYGEPIYHLQEEDTLIEPSFHEYYVHSSFKDFAKRAFLSLWS